MSSTKEFRSIVIGYIGGELSNKSRNTIASILAEDENINTNEFSINEYTERDIANMCAKDVKENINFKENETLKAAVSYIKHICKDYEDLYSFTLNLMQDLEFLTKQHKLSDCLIKSCEIILNSSIKDVEELGLSTEIIKIIRICYNNCTKNV